MRAIILFPIILLVAGCGTSTKLVSNNVEGASYTFDGSDKQLKKATSQAMEECQKFGRVAVIRNTSELDDRYLANFACVNSSL